MKKLVILESPGKIKKVSSFIKECDANNIYVVKASIGHVRQLESSGVYNMGIDINSMIPKYEISSDKKDVVKELIEQAKNCDQVILATDPDREGEAIAWHLHEILKPYCSNFKRMKLNAITKECVQQQLNNLGDLDQGYVNSALSRQMIDRMVGFRLSPIVRSETGGSSAGRVQSASLRILADRESEISSFNGKEYMYIKNIINELEFKNNILEDDKLVLNKIYSKEDANQLLNSLSSKYVVKKMESKDFEDKAFIPFATSSLYIAAKTKLKLNSKASSEIAQILYEKGLITYIRTDSSNLDIETETALKSFIISKYGEECLGTLKVVKAKETDQEGHPAITPTHFEWEPNESLKSKENLSDDEFAMYQMIWFNTVNSMYKRPGGIKTTIQLSNGDNIFVSEIKKYTEDGYYKIDSSLKKDQEQEFLLNEGDVVESSSHELVSDKEPAPSRFNEGTLIKKMEQLGIGRPSTYKSAVNVNISRNYVELENKKNESMVVNSQGIAVDNFLKNNYGSIINLEFTKNMEKDLDDIANSKITNHKEYLKKFYNELDSICSKYAPDTSETCAKCNNGYMTKRNYKDKKSGEMKSFKGCSSYPKCTNSIFE